MYNICCRPFSSTCYDYAFNKYYFCSFCNLFSRLGGSGIDAYTKAKWNILLYGSIGQYVRRCGIYKRESDALPNGNGYGSLECLQHGLFLFSYRNGASWNIIHPFQTFRLVAVVYFTPSFSFSCGEAWISSSKRFKNLENLSEIVYSVEKTRGHLALRELKGVKNLDTWINDRKGTMLMGATRKVNYIFVESFYYYLKIWAWYFSFKFELRPPFSAINIDFKCYNRICKYSWTVMIELVPKLYRKKICI